MEPTRLDIRRPAIEVLLELARDTYGYFRSSEAAALGVSASALSRLRARGTIESVAHGVNRIVAWRSTWEGSALLALWTSGPSSALAGWSALRLIEARSTAPRIEVLVPRDRRVHDSSARLRSHVRLTAEDIVEVGQLRVTGAAFTVCDLAARVDTDEVVRIADRLIAEGRLDLADLRVMVGRFWAIEGVQRLRDALVQLSPASRWTRSDGERTFRRLVASTHLPALVANHRVRDASGEVRYLDFAWPDLRIAFEIDLHPTHERTIGRNADGTRQNALVLAGWTVLRFDIIDLMLRPDEVLATVVAAHIRATS